MGHTFQLISHGAATTPDKILAYKHHYLNITKEPKSVTSADHIPLIFKMATQPFLTSQHKTYVLNKATWDGFQAVLVNEIHVKKTR